MISRLCGTLVARDLDRVEILTSGGVTYEVVIPLGVYEKLPAAGEEVSLFTQLVVREDAWVLYGFSSTLERKIFQRVLTASGVGPALAIGMLSALSAERLVRAIREKDLATLQGVPRVGRKKAERIILELAEKMDDLEIGAARGPRPEGAAAEDAIRALVSLGYTTGDAEKAVRQAIEGGGRGQSTPELIRNSLATVRGG